MKINELNSKTNKSKKRLGRGISSGHGKTSGRGTKGQGARTGSKAKPGFSGGQNPLMQQLPKLPGFKSKRIKAENISTKDLNKIKEVNIDSSVLFKYGFISSPYARVKLLNNDKIVKKITLSITSSSKLAIQNIEASGGTFNKTNRLKKPKKNS